MKLFTKNRFFESLTVLYLNACYRQGAVKRHHERKGTLLLQLDPIRLLFASCIAKYLPVFSTNYTIQGSWPFSLVPQYCFWERYTAAPVTTGSKPLKTTGGKIKNLYRWMGEIKLANPNWPYQFNLPKQEFIPLFTTDKTLHNIIFFILKCIFAPKILRTLFFRSFHKFVTAETQFIRINRYLYYLEISFIQSILDTGTTLTEGIVWTKTAIHWILSNIYAHFIACLVQLNTWYCMHDAELPRQPGSSG